MRFFLAALAAVLLTLASSVPPGLAQVTGAIADNYVVGSGTISTPNTSGAWVPIGRGPFVVDLWGDFPLGYFSASLERRNRAGAVMGVRGRTVNDGWFMQPMSTTFDEVEGAEYRITVNALPSGTVSWRIVWDRR